MCIHCSKYKCSEKGEYTLLCTLYRCTIIIIQVTIITEHYECVYNKIIMFT